MPDPSEVANAPRILIVEDEVMLGKDLARSLKNLGYDVIGRVSSSEEALRLVEESKPDLILMDIRLEGEADGIETAERIRDRFDIPVVYLTAYLEEDVFARAKRTEPYGYLAMPVGHLELRSTVEAALYKSEADKRVKQSEDRFRLLYENAPVPYQSLNENGYFVEVNPAWLITLGYSREEVIGKWFGDFLASGYQDRFNVNFPKFKAEGEIHWVEFEMVRKDGSQISVAFDGRVVLDQHGHFKQTHCTLHDITDLKKADEALRQSEERLNYVLHGSNEGFWDWNIETGEVRRNERWAEMLGYSFKDIAFTVPQWADLVHPEDRDRAWQSITDHLEGCTPQHEQEYRMRTKTGEWKWILDRARVVKRDEHGKPIRMAGTHTDITDRKQAEEALKESEELFSKAFENNPAFLTIIHMSTDKILDVNEAWTRAIGYTREEAIGRTTVELGLYDDAAYRKIMEEVNAQGSVRNVETTVKNRNLDERILLVSREVIAVQNEPHLLVMGMDITERKKAEEALRENEERLSLTLQVSNAGRWQWNIESDEVCFDGRFHEMLGYTKGDLPNTLQEWLPYHHPGDMPIWMSKAEEYLRGDSPAYESEHRIRNKAGTWNWVFTRGKLVDVTTTGSPKLFIGIAMDITDRKRSERELKEVSDFLDRIINSIPDPVFVKNEKHEWVLLNEAYCKFMGYSSEELIGKSDYDFFPRPEADVFWEKDEIVFKTGRENMNREKFTDRNGDTHTILTKKSLYMDPSGKRHLVGVIRDITEGQKAEEALKASEEKYRTVVEESFDGIMIQKGTSIAFANTRLHEMLSYDQGALEGMDHWLVYHPDYHYVTRSRAQARLRGETVPPRYEVNLLRKDGTSFPGEINAKVILFDNEPGIQVWIRDLTEQKLLEKRLVEAQKMEAVGTLAGGIAHDFNNILQVVSGHAELLEMELAQKGMKFSEMDAIRHASKRGADLVKQILTFSRKVDTKFETINLNDDVRTAERLLYRTIPKMINIRLDLEKRLNSIQADSTQIEQILLNLAINAKDAMPQGGTLTVRTQNIQAEDLYCSCCGKYFNGQYVLLEVSDTGHGMSGDVLRHIFEPFFTTKGLSEGTGLGLSTVYGIVEMHGGHVNCESEVGKGTTFFIYFPTIEEAKPGVQAEQEPAPIAGGTETILVVDDEPMISELARRFLTNAGYSVLTAGSGKEALDVYTRHKSTIALVILDLIMPEMGGEQCLRELLKIDPQVKAVIASGFAVEGRTKAFLDEEAKGRVAKPFNMRELLRAVRHVLDGTHE